MTTGSHLESQEPAAPARAVRDLAAGSRQAERRVRIVRVTARLNVGGIARHVTWLTAGLPASGYQTVLVTGSVPPGEDDMSTFALANGVTPHYIPEMSREISVKDVLTVWKLYRLLVRLQPDIVHSHAAKAGAVARLAGLLYRWLTPGTLVGRPRRCRFVHTYHGHIFHSYYGRLKTWLFLTIEKALARLATDRIIVISPRQLQEIHQTYGVGRPEQFRVVPLGLELAPYAGWSARRQVLREQWQAGDSDILVGIVGRLTQIKNHRLFLEAAALFKQRFAAALPQRVRFVIIGNGQLRQRLEAEAGRLGLQDEVVFLGRRDDPEYFYPALDIVALTSRNEGTPLTLIEALANARPVIAPDVGGVADLLGPERAGPAAGAGREGAVGAEPGSAEAGASYRVCERGILFTRDDVAGLSQGLRALVVAPEWRRELGERGQRFIESNFSRERLLRDLAALYDELTGQRAAALFTALGPAGMNPAARLEKEGETCAS